MSKDFQVISIDFKNPLTGETKKAQQFLGMAVFTAEELTALRKSEKTLGDLIHNIKIFPPEDIMKYAESDPAMKDLLDGIEEMKSEFNALNQDEG